MKENQLAKAFCSAPLPSPCLEGRGEIGGEASILKPPEAIQEGQQRRGEEHVSDSDRPLSSKLFT